MPDVLGTLWTTLQFYGSLNAQVYLWVGAILALLFGALPGISATTLVALLIPFTWGMDPMLAFILFGAAAGAACNLGGSIPAILINVPGNVPNWATTLDGYPLTVKGKSGLALGASAGSAIFGSLIGTAATLALLPIVSEVLVKFGPVEFFLLAMLGISTIAFLTRGNAFRSLVAGGIGLALSFIGFDPLTGVVRYTFGVAYLFDGIEYVAAIVGLFAVSEAIKLALGGRQTPVEVKVKQKFSDVIQGFFMPLRKIRLFLQSALIGFLVGITPGIGGSVATVLSWVAGSATSPKTIKFGTGVVDGVIASDTALCSKDGGDLLPTVAFGIPGSPAMAVILSAMIMHGLEPGPMMLTKNLPIVMVYLWAITLATIIVAAVCVAQAKFVAQLGNVPGNIIAPVIVIFCLIGTFVLNNAVWDVFICVLFGIVGFFMDKYQFSKVTMAIGLILGLIAERNFGLSLQISDVGPFIFFTRPISLVIIGLILVVLVASTLSSAKVRSRERVKADQEEVKKIEKLEKKPWQRGDFYVVGMLLIVSLAVFTIALDLPRLSRIFPMIVSLFLIALLTIDILQFFIPKLRETFGSFKGGEMFKIESAEKVFREYGVPAKRKEEHPNRLVIVTIIWFAASFVGFYFLGYLISGVLFLFLFLKYYAHYSYRFATIMTVVCGLFLWITFTGVLKLEITGGSPVFYGLF